MLLLIHGITVYLVCLSATKVMSDKAMTTNTLYLYCFFGFYRETSGNYFIFYFILVDTLLNEKTVLLTFSLFINIIQEQTHSLYLKLAKFVTVQMGKISTH